MSLLIALAAAVVLVGDEAKPSPAPAPDEAAARAARLAALPAGDYDIHLALRRAWERNPERVVCATRIHTGTKIPRSTCGTLRSWFNTRSASEIASGDAPRALVEEVRNQRRKAISRSR